MNKIIILHYGAIISILGVALSANANLIPLMILFALIFAVCAVKFAKVMQDHSERDRERTERHWEAHKKIRDSIEKINRTLDQKQDKPKSVVKPGTYITPEYIKMLEQKGVEVVDDRGENQKPEN